MTSIKFAYLQVMGTISGKFHQNPLKTVGVAETRLCLWTDRRMDEPKTIVPFNLRWGQKTGLEAGLLRLI